MGRHDVAGARIDPAPDHRGDTGGTRLCRVLRLRPKYGGEGKEAASLSGGDQHHSMGPLYNSLCMGLIARVIDALH